MADFADFEPVGGGPEGTGLLLQGGSSGSVDVRGGDMGPDPQGGASPE